MSYKIDVKLHRPDLEDRETPPDWQAWLVDRDRSPAHYIHIQFGSIGVDEETAQDLVDRILVGLTPSQKEE